MSLQGVLFSYLSGVLGGTLSYLLGAIPFALIIGRGFYHLDIREHGSGNVGATNVYRVLGPLPGIACLVLDASKGALPVLAGEALQLPAEMVVLWAMAAIVGHSRSVFLKFGGGKSVATAAGAILAMAPLVGLCTLGVWALAFVFSRIVSVGSLLAAVSLPVWMAVWHAPRAYLVFAIFASGFVILRHRPNLERLLAGQESRIGKSHDR